MLKTILPIFVLSASASDPKTDDEKFIVTAEQLPELYNRLDKQISELKVSGRGRSLGSSKIVEEDGDSVKITFKDTKITDALTLDTDSILVANPNLANDDSPKTRFGLVIPIQMVSNYGCWCYGGADWPTGEGRGSARDEHDDACKAHHMGFDCIEIDAEIENRDCKPTDTSYDISTIKPAPYGMINLECSNTIEDDWCKRRTCLVELRLLARYWSLIAQRVYPDYDTYGHTGTNALGPFDPMQSCPPVPGTGGGQPKEKRCCGDYPYRVWHYDFVNNQGDYHTQCCTYEDTSISLLYGFPITIGALYEQDKEKCTATGVADK